QMSSSEPPKEPFGPGPESNPAASAPEPTDYQAVPWFRKSGVCSAIIIAHLLVGILGGCIPLLSLLGIFTTLGVIGVCIVVLTGPVYYDKRGKDGTLRTWSRANKVAAVILLVIFVGGYCALVYSLAASGKFG